MGLEPQSFGAAVTQDIPAARKAALAVADRIASQHPTRYDATNPASAGWVVARKPAARRELIDLLDALGLHTAQPSKGES